TLGITSDMWGDVPYSEAFKGSPDGTGLRPKYDKQEFIYDTIQSLLDKGILNCQAESSTFSPSSDDVIYGGKLTKLNGLSINYSYKSTEPYLIDTGIVASVKDHNYFVKLFGN
ncbi:MAG: SusD/RagB family nutrient-binding outer membrane lipoprotein, partial [bacterium]